MGATTTKAQAREVMRRYFSGVNNEDWEDFAQIWHHDAVVDVTGGLHFEGVDEVLPYYPRVLRNFPVHYDDPYAIHVAGDIVTVEIAFRGETVDGVEATWEAVDVFTLRDGKIAKLTTWYDMGHVVNLLRTPGVPEKRLATLVRLAAEASPFYQRRFEALGLDAQQVAADLTLLPPTTEAELAADPGDFFVGPRKEIREALVTPSGGVLRLTRGDIGDAGWVLGRALELTGVTREDVIVPVASHPALAFAALQLRACLAPVGSTADVGATVLVAPDRGSLDDFKAAARTATARLEITTGGADPEVIETAPTGAIAARCAQRRGHHVFTDAHIVEIADGELLVTPLGRRGTPLLRYATGRRAAWLEGACACGSELPRLELE